MHIGNGPVHHFDAMRVATGEVTAHNALQVDLAKKEATVEDPAKRLNIEYNNLEQMAKNFKSNQEKMSQIVENSVKRTKSIYDMTHPGIDKAQILDIYV